MCKEAKFVDEVKVSDPDTGLIVDVVIYKHPNGGMFGIDALYVDQCFENWDNPLVPDPMASSDELESHIVLTE